MAVFCTLHIRSNLHADLPRGFLRRRKKMNLEFVDNNLPESRARVERMRKFPWFQDIQRPRYHWRLSSEKFVNDDDLYKHLMWVFERVRPNYLLSQLEDAGFEYWLSVFWQGNGTGGGPLITHKVAQLLTRHKVDMGVAFYLE